MLSRVSDAARLFDAPDLGGALQGEEDEALFLVPGSRAEGSSAAPRRNVELEDNSVLLKYAVHSCCACVLHSGSQAMHVRAL